MAVHIKMVVGYKWTKTDAGRDMIGRGRNGNDLHGDRIGSWLLDQAWTAMRSS